MKKAKTYSGFEKTVFVTGMIIILGLLGYLIFQSFSDKNTPPKFNIEINKKTNPQHCSFKVVIQNKGGTTAENVQLKFDLYAGGKPVASTTSSIDYIPIHSKETLRVVFYKKDKMCDSLVVSSITYLEP